MSKIDSVLCVSGGVLATCVGMRFVRRQPIAAWALTLMGIGLLEFGRSDGHALRGPTFDPVQEASEESFPASDAPAWAMR